MDAIDVAASYQSNEIAIICANISSTVEHMNKHHHSDEVFCEDCGVRIPEARLNAIPNAIRCIHCQSLYEENMR